MSLYTEIIDINSEVELDKQKDFQIEELYRKIGNQNIFDRKDKMKIYIFC